MDNYKVGSIVKGEVTGIEPYGIFIRIDNTYNGLIHISEISSFFVRNVSDFVKIGQHVRVKIIDIVPNIVVFFKLSLPNRTLYYNNFLIYSFSIFDFL